MNECYGCLCSTTKMNRLMCIVIYLLATSSFAYVAASGELIALPENNNNVMSVHPVGRKERDTPTGRPTTLGEYVATTPKIDISSTKAPSRYVCVCVCCVFWNNNVNGKHGKNKKKIIYFDAT